ncbi:MAG: SecE/Sec61-gamma subunit of protein translocation complex [Fibrobacterota bacterium]
MNKIKAYIGEVLMEVKKVTWPTKNELVESTWIVMGFSLVCGMFIYAVDLAMGFVVDILLNGGI